MSTAQDPGWRPVLRSMWSSFLPFVGFFVRRRWRAKQTDGLTILRGTQASLVLALFFFLAALSYIEPWGPVSDQRALALVGVLGLASLGMVVWMRRRPLPTPASSLAASYRAFFFIEVGYAESAALFGLAGAIITGSCWVYILGLAFSLIGHAMTAPTRRDIERRQREITGAGSPLSLLDALLAPPPRPGSATSE